MQPPESRVPYAPRLHEYLPAFPSEHSWRTWSGWLPRAREVVIDLLPGRDGLHGVDFRSQGRSWRYDRRQALLIAEVCAATSLADRLRAELEPEGRFEGLVERELNHLLEPAPVNVLHDGDALTDLQRCELAAIQLLNPAYAWRDLSYDRDAHDELVNAAGSGDTGPLRMLLAAIYRCAVLLARPVLAPVDAALVGELEAAARRIAGPPPLIPREGTPASILATYAVETERDIAGGDQFLIGAAWVAASEEQVAGRGDAWISLDDCREWLTLRLTADELHALALVLAEAGATPCDYLADGLLDLAELTGGPSPLPEQISKAIEGLAR